MSITMHGGSDALLVGPSDPVSHFPNLEWLETELQARNQPSPLGSTSSAVRPTAGAASGADSDSASVAERDSASAATDALKKGVIDGKPSLRPIKVCALICGVVQSCAVLCCLFIKELWHVQLVVQLNRVLAI